MGVTDPENKTTERIQNGVVIFPLSGRKMHAKAPYMKHYEQIACLRTYDKSLAKKWNRRAPKVH